MPISEQEKLKLRTVSRGIADKLFNAQVRQRYSDNQELLDCCLIQPFDSRIEAVDKRLTFYFVLENFVPVYDEKIHLRNKVKSVDSSEQIWMFIHLKFKERYVKIDGEIKALGQRRIKVSNIDVNKISEKLSDVFAGKTFTYGSHYTKYSFNNNKEIKLEHVESEKEAIDLISLVLPLTLNSFHHEGLIQDNILTVKYPKTAPKVDTHGLAGHVYKVTFHAREGKRTKQIYRVLVPNKARDK